MSKRSYISQSDVPRYNLEESLKVAKGIVENYAGDPTPPIQVAEAIDIKPSSSNFQHICGASIAYGLTNGGCKANKIELTELAKQILKPTEEGQEAIGLVQSGLKPKVLNDFFVKYNGSKFPKDTVALNVLETLGVPSDKTNIVLDIIKENGRFLGIIKEIKGSQYVHIDSPSISPSAVEENEPIEEDNKTDKNEELPDDLLKKLDIQKPASKAIPENPPKLPEKPRIFITHGKNQQIVKQLKELLTFGQFEAIVSIEKETTAIPVPDKVFEDMRNCQGAVIHVENESELMDKDGNTVHILNSNVLIEIGAAMALYGKNFILLCQKDVKLPSNLQGLYRCNYEGEGLDYESTMKLLKAFNEIRNS